MQTLARTAWVEFKLFTREPLTVLFTFAIPLVFLYVLGGVFGNTPNQRVYGGFGAMNFYVPAYIALVVAAIGLIAMPVHLASYRERGVLRRFRASSIPVWSVFGAQIVVTFILGVLASLLLVLVAFPGYNIERPQSLPGVIAGFILGAITFGAIGLLLGLALPTARAAQGVGVLLWFVMMIIDGAGPPFEVLPSSLVHLGDATPLKHLVLLIQDAWLGPGWNTAEMLFVGAFLAGASLLTLFFARRS
jgi:ABC-2 type transport system permease protein